MTNFRADLHCHSTCSDGTKAPAQLIEEAKKRGLSGLSITDHDTVSAYEEAIGAAKKEGIRLGSGVEFSSTHEGVSVHILGYDIDIENPQLLDFCKRHLTRRHGRNQRIIEKLAKMGMMVDLEQIEKQGTEDHPAGRPHIALALFEKGYVSSIQEAFDRFLGDGKCCFDPGVPMSIDETLEIIHHAGGKAFIAHPHLYKKTRFVENLLRKPFDGLECYYAKCTPVQEQKWVRVAKEKNLLMSGGSDFHGSVKPNIPLGCSWVDEETFDQIFEKHQWRL